MARSFDPDFTIEQNVKLQGIYDLIPQLLHRKAQLNQAFVIATAVVLPAELDPGPYEGPDATDHKATLFGLPIIWGDRAGLVV